MSCINYNGKNYVQGDFILSNAPIYSKGCRSSRDLIKKKNIASDKYIFARLKDNEWLVTDGKSVKFDKVFFKKSLINYDLVTAVRRESEIELREFCKNKIFRIYIVTWQNILFAGLLVVQH